MPPLMGPVKRAGDTFSSFSTPQKLIAAIGLAVLAMGGYAFVRWASTPTLAPLFTNLASSDASAIVDQLESQGIAYELTDGGQSIMVPREDVYRVRLAMSSAGLPSSPDTGYALLDEQGVTASQFQQQITYQRALEGELAQTINSINGVETAVVHLAIPAKDVFLDETQDPTGSVLVETIPGKEMPDQQVQSIVHLVSSSVEGLAAEDVTVVDGDGQLLSAAGQGGGAAGAMREQQGSEYEQRVAGSLQTVLDRVVGKGNAVATVTAELDFDAVDSTSETFSAEAGVPPLSSTTTTEEYTGTGAAVGGVLGPDNNQVPTGTAGEGNGYTKSSTTANNSVNKVTEHSVQAPGTVRRQSVAVVVDSAALGPVSLADLTDTMTAAAAIDTARGDTVSVTQMPFDTSASEAATAALEEAAESEAAAQRTSLIRDGAIALVVLLAVIVMFVMSRLRRRRASADALDIGPMQVLPPSVPAELEWVEDRELQTVGAPAALPASATRDLAAKRTEIAELVERQPDEVAELLRGWLADRRS